MADPESLTARVPEGALTLDELVFREVLDLDEEIRPGSAYDRAIRERLREKGLSEPEIERRFSIGRRQPKD